MDVLSQMEARRCNSVTLHLVSTASGCLRLESSRKIEVWKWEYSFTFALGFFLCPFLFYSWACHVLQTFNSSPNKLPDSPQIIKFLDCCR